MKGICFIEPLFHKVVDGSKTQTRRICKHQHFTHQELSNIRQGVYIDSGTTPRYKVGEILYLKEPYILYDEEYLELKTTNRLEIGYRFGNSLTIEDLTRRSVIKWENKLFMPEKYARFFIEVTAVRCEQLQDISEEDCIKEGIDLIEYNCFKNYMIGKNWIHEGINQFYYNFPQDEKGSYASLIDSINGDGVWDKNPFVFVYDFKLIQK